MSPAPDVLKEISIPHETVNDDVVIIARWCFEQGAAVRAQDVVAEIETSKAVLEVEAETEGFLDILHPEGAEVPVGALIGHVTASPAATQSAAAVATAVHRPDKARSWYGGLGGDCRRGSSPRRSCGDSSS